MTKVDHLVTFFSHELLVFFDKLFEFYHYYLNLI